MEGRRYLRPEEVSQILAWLEREAIVARVKGHRVPVRDEALFQVAFSGGLRASELADLHVSDVSLVRAAPQIVVRRGKGGKRREVALPSALKPRLKEYLAWMPRAGFSADGESPLFPSRTGRRITRSGIWRAWKVALKGAGLPLDCPLHATRHSCGLGLYRATKDLRLVQKHLGHARPATTAIYADVMPEDIEAGVDAAWKGLGR